MLSQIHARRRRSLLAVVAAAAVTVVALPLASPCASSAASTPAKKPAASAKAAAKKPAAKSAPKKQAGYHPHNGPAPADEYFGRLGMSVLGVRNKVKDIGLDADIHPEHAKAVLGTALWVEDAMRDWAKKYPFDRWLPRYAYALETVYERMPSDEAHRRALKQIAYLTAYFPQTVYGKVGRAKLAQGVPMPDPSDPPAAMTDLERLALLDGKVVPTLPPAATPKPSPVPAATPSPAAAATPSTEPAASPAPVAAPSTKP